MQRMTTRTECPVGEAVKSLDPEDRNEVQAILDNHVKSLVISIWLTRVRGFKGCTTVAVSQHRRHICVCEDGNDDNS